MAGVTLPSKIFLPGPISFPKNFHPGEFNSSREDSEGSGFTHSCSKTTSLDYVSDPTGHLKEPTSLVE